MVSYSKTKKKVENIFKNFQILAVFAWGVHYDRGCHYKWSEKKKDAWFKTYWKKQVSSYQTFLNQKLSDPATGGAFRNCQLNNGFDE